MTVQFEMVFSFISYKGCFTEPIWSADTLEEIYRDQIIAWDKVIYPLIAKKPHHIVNCKWSNPKVGGLPKNNLCAYSDHSAGCVVVIFSHQFASPPEGDSSTAIDQRKNYSGSHTLWQAGHHSASFNYFQAFTVSTKITGRYHFGLCVWKLPNICIFD